MKAIIVSLGLLLSPAHPALDGCRAWGELVECPATVSHRLPAAYTPPPIDATARLAGASDTWWCKVSAELAAAEYHPSFTPDGLQAANRAHNLRTHFRENGVEVVPRMSDRGVPTWRFAWMAARCARAGQVQATDLPILQANGSRVTYEHDGWSEWYENTSQGLEQGLTIERRPPGEGEMYVSGQLSAGLRPELNQDNGAIDFFDRHGAHVLRYGELKVWDALGVTLPSRLEVLGAATVAIVIDDRGAEYPLMVDPLLTSPAWTGEGDQAGAAFGCSVASAGDVNRDGFSDVIVGACNFDVGAGDEGRVFVYHGSPTGLGTTPAWTADGAQQGESFGSAVATAGDVDGDGFSDVIVGAPGYDNAEVGEGRALVYHGSENGLSGSPDWSAEGNQTGASFGGAVATAGDVNGNGIDDVIVGAPGYSNSQAGEGKAFVYYGLAAGLPASPDWSWESNHTGGSFGCAVGTAGDVNGDGIADVIVGASGFFDSKGRAFAFHGSSPGGLAASPAWTRDGDQAGWAFGTALATAGDVNGDGVDDVIVGAPRADNEKGRALVYYGSIPSGLGSVDWTCPGNQNGAEFGGAVGAAGDVNGDGLADVIVGARYYDHGETDEGLVFVYEASETGLPASPTWTAECNQAFAGFGASVGTAGDVNRDGLSDVIIGALAHDNVEGDEGRALVYHGWWGPCPIFTPTIGRFADNFPITNGNIMTTPARLDGAHSATMDLVELESQQRWVRSDSAFVYAVRDNAAVYFRFRVIPGPCQSLLHPFFMAYAPNAWHAARMDTAQAHGTGQTVRGSYMTCFHESDPRNGTYWSGMPSPTEPGDDILPDGVLTAGTRVQYFFELRDATTSQVVATFPAAMNCTPIGTAECYRFLWLETGVLPELNSSCDGSYAHNTLIINDFADNDVPGVATEMRQRLVDILSSLGIDFDIYDHVGSNYVNSYDGIGRREDRVTQQPRPPYNGATDLQLAGYDCIWYYSGLSTEGTLSDRRTLSLFGGQPSCDQQKLETWLAGCSTPNRVLVLEGLGWASDIASHTTNGSAFLTNRGIDVLASDYAELFNDYRLGARVKGYAPNMAFDEGEIFGSGCPGACPPCGDRLPIDVFEAGTGTIPMVNFVESLEGCASPPDCSDDVNRPGWLAVTQRLKPTHPCERSIAMSFPYTYLYPLDCSPAPDENDIDDFVINGQNAWLLIDLFQWAGLPINPNPIGVSEQSIGLREVALYPAAPNPANPSTKMRYVLPERARVSLRIYDLNGRVVRSLVDAVQEPQYEPFEVTWNGLNDDGQQVASGVFFYKLQVAGRTLSQKLVVLK